MAATVELTLGAVEAMAPALTAKATGALAADATFEIPCGFAPSRVTIIIDGTADSMAEYIEGMTGYLGIAAGAVAIDTTVIIVASDNGFTVNTAELGNGDYYLCIWR